MSSKLQRGSSSSSSSSQSATSSAFDSVNTSLAGFWRLPSELRDLTLQLACYRRPQTDTSDDTRSKWQLHLDGPTVASLAAVSRAFHTTFHSLLYAHVTLECPSRLAEFHASLVSAQVKSISLGPTSDFKEGWWPVRIEDEGADAVSVYFCDDEDNGIVFLRTSLDLRDKDLQRLPHWVEPKSEWAYQYPPQFCQEQAISTAVYTAMQHININPGLMFMATEEEYIGINEWTIRLFELQAVFDLYLCAMRRVDDESKRPVRRWASKEQPCKDPERCRTGECGHYPTLQLRGFDQLSSTTSTQKEEALKASGEDGQLSDTKLNVQPETRDSAGGDGGAKATAAGKGNEHDHPVCIVTREQVLNHISRRGASTDFFEHPLVYARSNMHILGIKDRKVIVDYEHEQTEDLYSFDSEGGGSESDADSSMDEESESSSSHFGSSISWPSSSSSSPQGKVQGVMDHARHRGIISLARSVLRRTYRLQNLSLSGSIHSLLSSSRIFVLHSIRSLSVGPFCPPSSAEYCVAWVKLPSLEKLRICGSTIAERTAADVAGEGEESWKKLREAEWDFGYPEEGDSIPAARLYKLLIRLHGWKIPQSERPKKHRRRIKVHLPPHLIGPVLDSARPPQLRPVWTNGSAVRGTPHILHVVESRAVKTVKDANGLQELQQDVEVLLRDSKRWWEERAFECKD